VYNKQYAPALKAIAEAANNQGVDEREVAAMLDKLEAEDPLFSDLTARVKRLSKSEADFIDRIRLLTNNISTLQNDIANKLVQAASLEDISHKLSLNSLSAEAKSQISLIEERMYDRMLEYSYYLAKAYEYRMLQPYTEPLTSAHLLEELDNFFSVDTSPDLETTRSGIIQLVYKDKLNSIYKSFVSKLNQEGFLQNSASVDFTLSPNQLQQLNNGGSVDLRLPDDIQRYVQSTSDRTYSLMDSITVTNIALDKTLVPNGAVKIELSIKNNASVISYKDKRFLFRVGNGNTPLYFSEYTYDPDTQTGTNSTRSSFDINEFLALTGLQASQVVTDKNTLTFFNKPSLESVLHIQFNPFSVGTKLKKISLKLNYAYIPINNYKSVQVWISDSVRTPYLIKDLTTGETSFYAASEKKVLRNSDKIQLVAARHVGRLQFDHWEDFNGGHLSSDAVLNVSSAITDLIAVPVYK
jgi:hypothetical protein